MPVFSLVTMRPLLSVTNLHIAFGKRIVIDRLTFEVNAGDCLAILGPNGSGKSVLLKALLHLIPYQGDIRWIEGAKLGYVPQGIAADRQLPMNMRNLFTAKAKFLRLPASEVDRTAAEVGLSTELLDADIGILSGGQFQKALIGFALLGQPNVLLFDEPTASLDELTEERVYESLHSLQADRGFTVILVSHDLSVVYQYATTVLCLSKTGLCMGPPQKVLTPQLLGDLYSAPAKFYQHLHHHGNC